MRKTSKKCKKQPKSPLTPIGWGRDYGISLHLWGRLWYGSLINMEGLPTTARAHGPTGPQAHGPTGPRAHGPMGPRAHGPTGPRGHGPMGPRAHGATGPRAHGPRRPRARPGPWPRRNFKKGSTKNIVVKTKVGENSPRCTDASVSSPEYDTFNFPMKQN